MQEIRDKVLAILAPNFDSKQLQMIDVAMSKVLSDYHMEKAETLPQIYHPNQWSEIAEYLGRKKSRGLQAGTIYQYKYVLTIFAQYVQKPLPNVEESDIRRFLDEYEVYKDVGHRRKDGMRVILNGFFRYVIDTGRITINPMATIEPIKYEKRVREAMTDLEFQRYRNGCKTPREKALVEFLFSTGCRVSEVVALNRDDIDFGSRRVKVFGKGSKERFVFIDAAAIVALDEYFKSRKDHNKALFVSEKEPHERIRKNAVENIITAIQVRSGLKRHVYPHLIRHTTATYLLRHGMRIDQVQIYLGHESLDTTRIYAQSDPEQLMDSYKKAMAA